MKESSRVSNPTIANCIDPKYQYTLLQPFLKTYQESDDSFWSRTYSVAWPDEWNIGGIYNGSTPPRFTCNTQHQVGGAIPIVQSITEYTSRTCFAGKLYLNGQVMKVANNLCIEYISGGGG